MPRHREIVGHEGEEVTPYERIENLERRMEAVEGAFPNGDPASHRRYHEELIAQGKDRRELIRAVRDKTIAGLVWAVMLGVGIACWKYFLGLIALVAGKGG